MPERIQRKRTKGWRMPENTVYVGRPGVFGNIFGGDHEVFDTYAGQMVVETLRAYREFLMSEIEERSAHTGHLTGALDAAAGYPRRTKLVNALASLRGKDLACWCPLDHPCHADVLLEIANDEPK